MFVTALEMNNLDYTRTDEQFTDQSMVGAHSWVEAYIASPTSLPLSR